MLLLSTTISLSCSEGRMTPKPSYTVWEAISASLALGMRALEEVRALARAPGPPGRDGEAGRDGVDGRDGKDGRDGRDGTDGEFTTPVPWLEGVVFYDGDLVC